MFIKKTLSSVLKNSLDELKVLNLPHNFIKFPVCGP